MKTLLLDIQVTQDGKLITITGALPIYVNNAFGVSNNKAVAIATDNNKKIIVQ